MIDSAFYDKRSDRIGLSGDSYSLNSINSLISSDDITAEALGICAAVVIDGESETALEGFQVPIYENIEKMLSANPDINMIFELSGRYDEVDKLRHLLPASISLVELRAARFFLRLQASDKLWLACKMDLMQTQSLLKSVVDQIPEDIIFLDSDGLIMDCNQHFSASTGIGINELRGRNPVDFIKTLSDICPMTEDGTISVDDLYLGKRIENLYSEVDSQGRIEFFRVYVYPILTALGVDVRHLAVMRRNITERTVLEHRLRKTERMAAMGELSAYIAHEIRNPLFSIAGFARSLKKISTIDEDGREKLDAIVSEAARLEKLLNSVLGFVRPHGAGLLDIDVNEVVENTMRLLTIGCNQQGVTVKLDLDPDSPRAEADADLIRQCLINVVKNSVEAIEGSGKILITTGTRGEFVFIGIKDNGKGIPPEVLSRVFEPFFSTTKNGSGLGLAMVSKIMHDLGGDVKISSNEKGTTVTLLLLPVAAVAQKEPT